jgi:hypothetical protein
MNEDLSPREFAKALLAKSRLSDVQHGHLWDSITFEPGESLRAFELFRIPMGQDGKTIVDTNLQQSSSLPAPESFSIQRVAFTFNEFASDEDIYGVAESVVWKLWLGSKVYALSPMIALQVTTVALAPIRECVYCHAMYAMQERCPGCGAAEFRLDSLGELEAGKCFFMDLPKANFIVIPSQLSFYISCEIGLHAHRFSKKLKMWCHFEGQHARGVS